jgi:hypothetical protein
VRRTIQDAIGEEVRVSAGYATEISRIVIQKFGHADGTGRAAAVGLLILAVALMKRAKCSRGDLLRMTQTLFDRSEFIDASNEEN